MSNVMHEHVKDINWLGCGVSGKVRGTWYGTKGLKLCKLEECILDMCIANELLTQYTLSYSQKGHMQFLSECQISMLVINVVNNILVV